MTESRCGLLCSACEFRESAGCGGCTRIDRPFWGEGCAVKSCCEARNLPHCGLCGSFPCRTLEGFAYDSQQGDNGARLERCAAWREEALWPAV